MCPLIAEEEGDQFYPDVSLQTRGEGARGGKVTGAASMWVLPPNLPAFCSSSVILETVGDLMPMPQPCPHREMVARPSCQRRKSSWTAVLRGRAVSSPTQIWYEPGAEGWLLESAKFYWILCPLGPSSIACGLAPGFTLSLVESELSCMAQIYKHMLAASSGKLAS